MKSIVIYDSHTGNTKKVAQSIHAGMSRSGAQSDIARLRDVDTLDLAGYDLIGLGSPVIWLQEFGNVTRFLEDTLQSMAGKHSFAFCTHGALPTNYLARVVAAMRQKDLTVIGWNDWFGSVAFPVIPKPYFTDGHPDEIDLKEAEDFGREMVERSRRISLGEVQLIPTFPEGRAYEEIYDPCEFNKLIRDEMNDTWVECNKALAEMAFKVDTEKCKYPKCTVCKDNCPMGAIDLSVSPPLFNSSCGKCFVCEQTCPNGAIGVDWMAYQKAHDPFVPVLLKSIETFEARGSFRRLIPVEDIGWDTPMWTFKKPRYKIK